MGVVTFFLVLGIKLRALCMLGNHYTREPYLQPLVFATGIPTYSYGLRAGLKVVKLPPSKC